MPNTEYVQFLVNPQERKLAIKPCTEDAKDSFRWCTIGKDGKARPKSISCRIFFGKVMSLMGWNPDCRYRILGKLIRTKTENLFVFDFTNAETFKRRKSKEGPRDPYYPKEWSEQFGLPVNEHQNDLLVSIFEDHAVFYISKEEENGGKNK